MAVCAVIAEFLKGESNKAGRVLRARKAGKLGVPGFLAALGGSGAVLLPGACCAFWRCLMRLGAGFGSVYLLRQAAQDSQFPLLDNIQNGCKP